MSSTSKIVLPEEMIQRAREASPLLSRREAAAYLGISEQTLAIWKCTGRYGLPYIKIGRLVKYYKHDLDTFIFNNSVGKLRPHDIQDNVQGIAKPRLRLVSNWR